MFGKLKNNNKQIIEILKQNVLGLNFIIFYFVLEFGSADFLKGEEQMKNNQKYCFGSKFGHLWA